MRLRLPLGAFVLFAAAAPAMAQSAGAWRVNGAISGRTFTLDCRLEAKGGVCIDASPGGKSHALTSLTAANDQVSWSFKTTVMLMSITLSFDGRVQGGQMSGAMRAAGRTGRFTAVRS